MKAREAGISLGELTMLKGYERRRKLHNMVIMGSMDFLKRSSTSDSKLVKVVRNLGLTVADKAPFAKKKLARIALGYYGDIPKFVKP